jgi:cytidine deaminase
MPLNACLEELAAQAAAARRSAYAPYSHFSVGAAALDEDGSVFLGSNVENASYGLTVCAERVAIFKAVTAPGRSRRTTVTALAVSATPPVWPCGACRQVLAEFAGAGCLVILADAAGNVLETATLGQLLPHAFGASALATGEQH